jgi:hypothetical protein
LGAKKTIVSCATCFYPLKKIQGFWFGQEHVAFDHKEKNRKCDNLAGPGSATALHHYFKNLLIRAVALPAPEESCTLFISRLESPPSTFPAASSQRVYAMDRLRELFPYRLRDAGWKVY